MSNPFGMDDACTHCPELVECRQQVVHGYGDVTGEFLFIREAPRVDATAFGYAVDPDSALAEILSRGGFVREDDVDHPVLDNAFLTHLTRCRHPDRGPTDSEIRACNAFLNAEIRSINPEVLIPIGQQVFESVAEEFATGADPADAISDIHGTTIRGRGFELIPMIDTSHITREQIDAFLEAIEATLSRDYRQTKGRRSR